MGGRSEVSMETKSCGRLVLSGLVVGLVIVALFGCKPSVTVSPPDPYVTGEAAATPTLAVPQQVGTAEPTATAVEAAAPESLAAMVGDTPIYLRDYQKQVTEWELAFVTQNTNLDEQAKIEMLEQGRRQVLDVMIEQVLIEQAAEREGIHLTDAEVESVIARDIEENGGREQFEAWLQENNWTYQEYQERQRSMMIASQMFEQVTRDVPTTAEQVHARHILVATEQEAREVLAKLQGGADFAELARQYSLDPSNKDSGGDLGFFPRATLVVPEIEDVAFSLQVGQISDVIQSPIGYHIIQVLERVQDRPLTEESWQALKETTFREWIGELWASTPIDVRIAF
jgi:parvulin-like peptidyl-prolyl isomerase